MFMYFPAAVAAMTGSAIRFDLTFDPADEPPPELHSTIPVIPTSYPRVTLMCRLLRTKLCLHHMNVALFLRLEPERLASDTLLASS